MATDEAGLGGPLRILRPDAVVVDVEPSGLHDRSYPIEVGWCRDDRVGSSLLIRAREDVLAEIDGRGHSPSASRSAEARTIEFPAIVEREVGTRMEPCVVGSDLHASMRTASQFSHWISRRYPAAIKVRRARQAG